ncbi:putative metallophosphoesterase [Monocercomonoides exilis]|uniref:putative metallophosphoesterase n=1 Tax=Monocercomonoides exilis TaxID=2049356 RepID=UPI003559A48E|nr:putative metallophosphoesterase [Monocercomonoides exilis]|eukprot:MONOS_11301.1-p1 / transcript=MONOS_11301.1 / gene=MONOS_11301 / organism=Monocercomonoides_exilis_PA203 / gene_product=metallophosphoesterase / transcript_product=metallophosphoesterase / location=Mono_scaffold00560:18217-19251(+) / protein_length=263 / sequence_SO=supercontig / SO=protein_coding / is_pseudo=false
METNVYVISDVHVDYKENLDWMLSLTNHENDVLIIPGDISNDISKTLEFLYQLKQKFREVFFTPGNHDLWITDKACGNSLNKLEYLLSSSKTIGVKVTPAKVDELWIVPLLSWYDSSLSSEPLTAKDKEELKCWSDFFYCSWPSGFKPTDLYERNESVLNSFEEDDPKRIISFSHMIPRRDLLPPTPLLNLHFLPHVVGSTRLEHQIRRLRPCVHCFGHSHINTDLTIEGIRYVQNALGYPSERKAYGMTPSLVRVWPSSAHS